MSSSDKTSEATHLVPPTASKPSYVNLVSNASSLGFLLVILYCSFSDGVTLFSFHPIFMTIGWLILMTSAINAVTPGDFATEWMPMRLRSARHWVIQLITGTSVLLGFIIIVTNKFIYDKPHFATLHAKFGLASFVLMIVTKLGGLGVLYSIQLKSYMAPLYTKLIHASIGLITFSLGIIAILLALFSGWWKFGEILRYICLALVLIIMIATILRPCLKIYFRIKEKINN